MNKILPIILVVVLSGCGNSAIEGFYDYSEGASKGSFESKLKRDNQYFNAAAECEILQKKAPETFNSRWK